MKRLMVALIFGLGLLLGSWLALPRSEAAAWHCRFPYTVRPGDTLSGIAARLGTNVWYLAQLNGLWNIHHIYAGQVLCLPASLASSPTPTSTPQIPPPPPTPTLSSAYSSLDLVVEYTFYPTATYPPPATEEPPAPPDELDQRCGVLPPLEPTPDGPEPTPTDEPHPRRWTLGYEGIAGIRRSYCLTSGDAIFTVPLPDDVRKGAVLSATSIMPILWIARSNETTNTFTYTLVAIGDPTPLLKLQLGATRTITQLLKNLPPLQTISDHIRINRPPPISHEPVNALLDSNSSQVRLRAELMGRDGTYIPISIAAIDYHVNITSAKLRYTRPGFALQVAPEADSYQLWMAFNTDTNIVGPPGNRWRQHCRGWRGGGWWSRWRRSWWGC